MVSKEKIREIEEILLGFAEIRDEVTQSDLQGIATAETYKIIKLLEVEK